MIGPFLLLYIKLRTGKNKKDIETLVSNYYKLFPQLGDVRIYFSAFFFFPFTLEANAQIRNKILLSAEWAVILLTNNNSEINNAFSMTIGHELTHKDKDFPTKSISSRDRKFINWVNEVHADFGAAEKMVACNREKLKESIRFKSKMKPKNKDSRSHPSWKRRLECATNYNFNEELIRKIYEDSGCKNTELLNKVIDFYKDRYIALI